MSGHGHVLPNANGSKARCGGPTICGACAIELAELLNSVSKKAPDKIEPCAHDYEFVHTVYSFSERTNPGGSGRDRYLEDKFFCRRCLHTSYANNRINGDNYSLPIYGSVPK